MGQELHAVLPEDLGRHLVTCGPVVHKRQETLRLFDTAAVIFHRRYYESMKLVLIEKAVREIGEKIPDILPLRQYLRIRTEFGGPNSA